MKNRSERCFATWPNPTPSGSLSVSCLHWCFVLQAVRTAKSCRLKNLQLLLYCPWCCKVPTDKRIYHTVKGPAHRKQVTCNLLTRGHPNRGLHGKGSARANSISPGGPVSRSRSRACFASYLREYDVEIC